MPPFDFKYCVISIYILKVSDRAGFVQVFSFRTSNGGLSVFSLLKQCSPSSVKGGGGLTGHNRPNSCIANLYISKMGGFTCQLLGNVDMHTYATCYKNIPCRSRVMNILYYLVTDGWTSGLTCRPKGRAICYYKNIWPVRTWYG